ncbi:hypothetical protein L208DRAFT_1338569 [Tricholoma matsutake]|nr:hypothetical protein L208DRAFT_1338569 [Tricholoma matsutake 945]
MADQPALGLDGQLLDASKIIWYNNSDADHPIQPAQHGIIFNLLVILSQRFIYHAGHSTRSSARVTTGSAQLAAAIAAEKLDEFGNLLQPHQRANAGQPCTSWAAPKCKRTVTDNPGTDADDDNFTTSSTDDALDNDGDTNIMDISNEEIADMLPSKTIPEVNHDNGKKPTHALKPKVKVTATAPLNKKARARSVEVEEIEDKDSACNIAARNNGISLASSFEIPGMKGTGRNLKKSPIYHFYEIVTNGLDGTPGDDGDVHYHCLHGAHKVCTIKRSMRSNLNSVLPFFLLNTWFA